MSDTPERNPAKSTDAEAVAECFATFSLPLALIHRLAIEAELRRQDGNIAQAARVLGIGRTTLHRFLRGKHRRSMKT